MRASEQNIRFDTRARLIKYINQLSSGEIDSHQPKPPAKLSTEPNEYATDHESTNHNGNGVEKQNVQLQERTTEKKPVFILNTNHSNDIGSDHEPTALKQRTKQSIRTYANSTNQTAKKTRSNKSKTPTRQADHSLTERRPSVCQSNSHPPPKDELHYNFDNLNPPNDLQHYSFELGEPSRQSPTEANFQSSPDSRLQSHRKNDTTQNTSIFYHNNSNIAKSSQNLNGEVLRTGSSRTDLQDFDGDIQQRSLNRSYSQKPPSQKDTAQQSIHSNKKLTKKYSYASYTNSEPVKHAVNKSFDMDLIRGDRRAQSKSIHDKLSDVEKDQEERSSRTPIKNSRGKNGTFRLPLINHPKMNKNPKDPLNLLPSYAPPRNGRYRSKQENGYWMFLL